MKSYKIYVCEICGKESKNYKVIQECEAAHLGVTWQQYLDYRRVKHWPNYYFNELERRKKSSNPSQYWIDADQENLNKSIAELDDFEIKHGIVKESENIVREKIKSAMEDMSIENKKGEYVFVRCGIEIRKKKIKAFDAYMLAYEMAKYGDTKCYFCTNGVMEADPIFSVIKKHIILNKKLIN